MNQTVIRTDVGRITSKDVVDQKSVTENTKVRSRNISLHHISDSFARYLLTHEQSDDSQKAAANKLFNDFMESYELE